MLRKILKPGSNATIIRQVGEAFIRLRDSMVCNEAVDSTYHGPTYRAVSFDDPRQLAGYITSGGLASNAPDTNPAFNYSIKKYVDSNARSPWFGGCATLFGANRFINNQRARSNRFVIGIAPVPTNDPRFKEDVNAEYYSETGEHNPRAYEEEVIHRNGDYGNLVRFAINARHLPDALQGFSVPCALTGRKINPLAWHDEQSKASSSVSTKSKLAA